MQVATILPTHYLEAIEDRPYHLALAHLIGKDKGYTNFYLRMAKEGKFVILDNGVIETGKSMPIERIVELANQLGAAEIVLPDVLDDADATLDAVCEASEYARANFDGQIMAVPQGKDYDTWIECATMMLAMDIDTLGIPKRLVKLAGRDGRLLALKQMGYMLRGLDIHLLGCWETPIEVTMIEQAARRGEILPVRGVDSGIAYMYARENMLISQGPKPTGAVDFSAKDAPIDTLLRNIEIWENACNPSEAASKVKNLL